MSQIKKGDECVMGGLKEGREGLPNIMLYSWQAKNN